MFYILGAIPYAIVGLVMASMGYDYTTWQLWVIFACMLASDGISIIKTLMNK